MKRIVLLFALLFLSSAMLMADTIDYSTSGTFSSTTGSLTNGNMTITFGSGADQSSITFDPQALTSINAPSYTSLGSFVTSSTGTGASLTGTTNFELTITQTVPTSGTGGLDSTVLDGTLSENSSGLAVMFSTSSIAINGVTYSLTSNPIALVPPSAGGTSTIEAYVTPAVATPEPGSMALFSSGLVFFGLTRRKLKLF